MHTYGVNTKFTARMPGADTVIYGVNTWFWPTQHVRSMDIRERGGGAKQKDRATKSVDLLSEGWAFTATAVGLRIECVTAQLQMPFIS
jgi:hypothetical protein